MLKFASNLKLLRKKNGLTQKQVADLLDITERQYQRYEAGTVDPPTSKTKKLSIFFDISLDYLTGLIDDPNVISNDKNKNDKQNLTQEETELLEDFRLLNKHEQNIIIGKVSEMIYNKIVEENNNNLEVSEELLNVELMDRLNK